MRLAYAALALAGCYAAQHPEVADGAPADIGTSPADASSCVGSFATFCFDGNEKPELDLVGQIDTSSDACLAEAKGLGVCVLAATRIRLASGATVRVIGSLPLALIARDSIDLGTSSILDASSGIDGPGPGAGLHGQPDPCNVVLPTGNEGGPGGSFAAMGGSGGASAMFPAQPAVQPFPTPTQPLTGCPGADAPLVAGSGGQAGGIVILAAGNSITLAGEIHADGAGGREGANATRAGGGGGAGGLIAIDSHHADASNATITAIGGGGGGGGAGPATSPKPGNPGLDGADGGAGGDGGVDAVATGGKGGDGGGRFLNPGTKMPLPGAMGNQGGAGGGGGGSYGYVLVIDALVGAGDNIQPPVTTK